jgi:O-antigen ligase
MTERNDLTAGAVGTIPILVYFAFSYAWRFRILVRAVCLVAAVLCVCVIFLSLSRGSSIGLFVSLFFYIFIVSRRKIRDFVLVGCFIALAFLLAPSVWYERMSTIEIGAEQKESSAMQRMEAMTGAFHATLDRPVFGWGPAGWLEVAPFYTSMTANPHNIYLKVSSEVGITGLLIYLGIMVMTYVRLLRVVKPANRIGDKDTARLAIAQASCIIGLLSALTFLNAPFGEYLWTWICLANALPGVFRKELAAKRKRVRPEPGLPDLPGLAPATT